MTTSPSAIKPPTAPPRPWHLALGALGWGLACAACASGVSLSVFLLLDARIEIPNVELERRLPESAIIIAAAGIVGGLLGGLLVGLLYPAFDPAPRVLVIGGALAGAIGGGVTIPAVILCREWMSPLVSSTLLWGLVGFLAGLGARWRANATARRMDQHGEDTAENAGRGRYRWNWGAWAFFRAFPLLAVAAFVFLTLLTIATVRY